VSIIVGVHCRDCVVLAASGPAPISPTEGTAAAGVGGRVRAVAGRAVVGISGPDELGREVTDALERYLRDRAPDEMSGDTHGDALQAALGQRIRLTADMARALEGLPGAGATAGNSMGEVLIAMPGRGQPSLHVVDSLCRVKQIDRGRAWAAIGPAKLAAESFLVFLQRLLWREGRPNRAAGQLAAYWAVRHVTEMEGGSSRSVQMVRLSQGEGESANVVWHGERVIASLRRAMDAGVDEIRAGLKRRVLIDFEIPVESAVPTREQPTRPRVPEVRVTLRGPEDQDRRPRW